MTKNRVKTLLQDGLTLKEYTFCHEYVKNGGNATAAAIIAYPDTTYDSQKAIGYENLTKPHISDYIAGLLAKNLNNDFIIQELMKDVKSHDKTLRTNALNNLVKIQGMITEKHVNIEQQKQEYDQITYKAFNEAKVKPEA